MPVTTRQCCLVFDSQAQAPGLLHTAQIHYFFTAHAGGRLAFERGDRRLFFYKSEFWLVKIFHVHTLYILLYTIFMN